MPTPPGATESKQGASSAWLAWNMPNRKQMGIDGCEIRLSDQSEVAGVVQPPADGSNVWERIIISAK